MEERDAVSAANQAFYRAFETLNLTEMEKVWLQASHIKCIHPGWPLLAGWGPVMASWQRIFANTQSMRFDLTDVRVEVSGSLGWAGPHRESRIGRTGRHLPLTDFDDESV